MPTPEEQARSRIDALREAAGWELDDEQANPHAGRGVVIRELPLLAPFPPGEGLRVREGGFADRLSYVDGETTSVIEASTLCATPTRVAISCRKYAPGRISASGGVPQALFALYSSSTIERRRGDGMLACKTGLLI
jgi:hypothetical protein